MADNDQNNDEYKFSELDDAYESDTMENNDYGMSDSPSGQTPPPPRKDVKRNALIAVGIIAILMVLYKLLGGLFSGKSSDEAAKGAIPPAPIATVTSQQPPQPQPQLEPQPQPAPTEIAPQPIQPVQPVVQESPALKQQVESIATNQQNVQSQVSTISEQVTNVNNNVTSLTSQINQLNQTIADLNNQLSKQSEVINILMERTKPKIIKRVTRTHYMSQPVIYYINAVIPGRAWLIASNGSTLTVREGTKIAGYGVVKLIDSMEGRVITSSGRIIRFSQDDS